MERGRAMRHDIPTVTTLNHLARTLCDTAELPLGSTCALANGVELSYTSFCRSPWLFMHWFFLTLISPFSHAIVNFLDKFLINRYTKSEDAPSVGSLILFSSLFSILILPIFLLFGIPAAPIEFTAVLPLLATGLFYFTGLILYLYALAREDVSNIVPFWLTAPVFDFILAWFYLGEQLSSLQMFACLAILLGAVILSIGRDENGEFHVKWQAALYMLGSSAVLSLNDLLFKKSALNLPFWDSLFFTYMGYLFGGVILFIFVASYRHGFIRLIRTSGSVLLGVNVAGELLMIVGDTAVRFATLLAPLALVETIAASFQPLAAFGVGIVITMFFPSILQESLEKEELIRKTAAIAIMIVGTSILMFIG